MDTAGLSRIPVTALTAANIGERIVVDHEQKPSIRNRQGGRITAAGTLTAVSRGPAGSIKLTVDGRAVYVPANAWPHITATPANREATAAFLRRREARAALRAEAARAHMEELNTTIAPTVTGLPERTIVDETADEINDVLRTAPRSRRSQRPTRSTSAPPARRHCMTQWETSCAGCWGKALSRS
ncbi:hypothetical protein OVN20_05345 [Microcella daejeonensis]|uniref:hypothetical protein n=1 Tax=Microcella daejeonensis TaxID=2994971 RepID=UPI00226D6126|nr:hypothetical protein [Microcella daejeonensis]WAB84977.1 hypothetical protein OVN20_05345 [Microcella daejeonensis]